MAEFHFASVGQWAARGLFVLCSAIAFVIWHMPTTFVGPAAQQWAQIEGNGIRGLTQGERRALRDSLVWRPLASDTLLMLAHDAEANGDAISAQRLLKTAQRVSRRNAAVEAALIQHNAIIGEVGPMLSAIHALISVYPEMSARLLPPLAASLRRHEIRLGLIPYVRQQARWMPELWSIATKSAPVDDLASFAFRNSGDLSRPQYRVGSSLFLARLAATGFHGEVRDLLPRLIPGTDASVLDRWSPDVATANADLGALGWAFVSSDGAVVTLDQPSVLKLQIAPLRRVTFAQRDLLVKAGHRYAFSWQIDQDRSGGDVRLRLELMCIRSDNEILLFNEPVFNGGGRGSVFVPISVPEDCNLLRIKLGASGPDSQFDKALKLYNFKFASNLKLNI